MIYQYLTKLKRIRVNKEFLEEMLPIMNNPGPYDLSNAKDNFLVFTRSARKGEKKNRDNGILVPDQLLAYSFILNPIRLAILKILYEYNNYISADLRKNLKVSWGSFSSHVKSLIDEGMIASNEEFVESKVLKVLYLEDKGRQSFSQLKSILQVVVI
jgi:DNA-binding MarR family transcriptional regulator